MKITNCIIKAGFAQVKITRSSLTYPGRSRCFYARRLKVSCLKEVSKVGYMSMSTLHKQDRSPCSKDLVLLEVWFSSPGLACGQIETPFEHVEASIAGESTSLHFSHLLFHNNFGTRCQRQTVYELSVDRCIVVSFLF